MAWRWLAFGAGHEADVLSLVGECAGPDTEDVRVLPRVRAVLGPWHQAPGRPNRTLAGETGFLALTSAPLCECAAATPVGRDDQPSQWQSESEEMRQELRI